MCKACVKALKAYAVSIASTHILQQNKEECTCINEGQRPYKMGKWYKNTLVHA